MRLLRNSYLQITDHCPASSAPEPLALLASPAGTRAGHRAPRLNPDPADGQTMLDGGAQLGPRLLTTPSPRRIRTVSHRRFICVTHYSPGSCAKHPSPVSV